MVETFKYFQISTKMEKNRVHNSPKWELCAKMTKTLVFFGAETTQGTPLCQKLNTVKNINIFGIFFL